VTHSAPGSSEPSAARSRAASQGLDPLGPPRAAGPTDALKLACQALSDGDLEAAVSLYEDGAVLSVEATVLARGTEEVRQALARVMACRVPVGLVVHTSLTSGGTALVVASRHLVGEPASGCFGVLGRCGASVLRQDPALGWLFVADSWSWPTLAGGVSPP